MRLQHPLACRSVRALSWGADPSLLHPCFLRLMALSHDQAHLVEELDTLLKPNVLLLDQGELSLRLGH